MNISALYHRPESEFAFLYAPGRLHIRLRTALGDVEGVSLISGDPYLFQREKWYQQEKPMKKGLSTAAHDYWEIELTAPFSRLQYGFIITGQDGQQVFYCDQGVYPCEPQYLESKEFYFRMPYFQEVDRFKAPDWVKHTVWYQIFPERFANGDTSNDPAGTLPWGSKLPNREDFFGGDLQGVMDHLDYLEELGITGIYFCPIFKAASNHKYDTVDYFEIDSAFGDKELFKKLVTEAHRRGIRVMLDAVFNHIGSTSSQWQDVCQKGAKSRYADWFHIYSFPVSYQRIDIPEMAENITYDTFSFNPDMPKLNTANPEVQAHLLEIASYWIQEFDIDAWRLDVANEVDHHFWKRLRQRVDELKKDFYLLGEIWHSSQSWLNGDEFHGVMNYAFTDNINEYFALKTIPAEKMISGLNQQQMLYRDQTNEVMFNLLDSHDTPRLLTLCEGDSQLARMMLAFLFLQKGSPCIYYGTEVGMAGDMDPDCRRCMVWDEKKQDLEMLQFMKQLISLRKKIADFLIYGSLEWQLAGDDVIIFKRKYQGHTLTGWFNAASDPYLVDPEGENLLGQGLDSNEQHQQLLQPNGFLLTLG